MLQRQHQKPASCCASFSWFPVLCTFRETSLVTNYRNDPWKYSLIEKRSAFPNWAKPIHIVLTVSISQGTIFPVCTLTCFLKTLYVKKKKSATNRFEPSRFSKVSSSLHLINIQLLNSQSQATYFEPHPVSRDRSAAPGVGRTLTTTKRATAPGHAPV